MTALNFLDKQKIFVYIVVLRLMHRNISRLTYKVESVVIWIFKQLISIAPKFYK